MNHVVAAFPYLLLPQPGMRWFHACLFVCEQDVTKKYRNNLHQTWWRDGAQREELIKCWCQSGWHFFLFSTSRLNSVKEGILDVLSSSQKIMFESWDLWVCTVLYTKIIIHICWKTIFIRGRGLHCCHPPPAHDLLVLHDICLNIKLSLS